MDVPAAALAAAPAGQRLRPALPEPETGYRAGACNIGPYEIARRRRAGLSGVAAAVLLAVALLAIDAPQLARILVLFPLWGGFVSLLQARRRFCVGFAFAGLENFGDEEAARRRVVDEDARAADRRVAMLLIRDAFFLAAPLTALFVVLPI